MGKRTVYSILWIAFVLTFFISFIFGAITISWKDMYGTVVHLFSGTISQSSLDERIFFYIRMPRVILCCIAGAALSAAGAVTQALFRNPIVEPGLIGTSGGAAFGAALLFVFGSAMKWTPGEWTMPIAAFCGGAFATWLVYLLASAGTKKQSVTTLLLCGIAVNAMFMSGVGFLSYLARDPQARSITFWNLGTLSGASWTAVFIVGIICTIAMIFSLRKAKDLQAMLLGEEEATMLGVNTRRLKLQVSFLVVLMVAGVTAFTGVISFVGLVVPHLVRRMNISNTRSVIFGSALAGAILLNLADIIARTSLAPAEIPIGIITSIVGAPFFLYLVRRSTDFFGE
ncbi:MAG TPA: iron ABC transporter permease [Bacteroidia bacterium]|nr:iron ABC transporter permease [Bacteroidia bacterium]